jgi:hypothetical protein
MKIITRIPIYVTIAFGLVLFPLKGFDPMNTIFKEEMYKMRQKKLT